MKQETAVYQEGTSGESGGNFFWSVAEIMFGGASVKGDSIGADLPTAASVHGLNRDHARRRG